MRVEIIPYPKRSVKENLVCAGLGAEGLFVAGKTPEAALPQRAREPLPSPRSPEVCAGEGTANQSSQLQKKGVRGCQAKRGKI